MRQLTGLDATFLALDSPTVCSHLGCMAVLDPPVRGPVLNRRRLTGLIESRLHLAPPFRRRLTEVPFGLDQPYWIEDPDFDIEFHVRELALPARVTTISWPLRPPACTSGRWTAPARCGRCI